MPFVLCAKRNNHSPGYYYYSSVDQIKLYIFRQRNDRKYSAISTFECYYSYMKKKYWENDKSLTFNYRQLHRVFIARSNLWSTSQRHTFRNRL